MSEQCRVSTQASLCTLTYQSTTTRPAMATKEREGDRDRDLMFIFYKSVQCDISIDRARVEHFR